MSGAAVETRRQSLTVQHTGPSFSDAEVFEAFVGYLIDRDNVEHYRGRLQRRLIVNKCSECRHLHHPPQAVCPHCWHGGVEPAEVSGNGTVTLRSVVHVGPAAPGIDYEKGHTIVVVELDEEPGLYFGSAIDERYRDEIGFGTRVSLMWLDRAGVPVPAFQPAGPVQ